MPELTTEFIEELTKKLRAIGSLKAVGDTWVSFDSSVPPGGVPFCGQTVSRALYADLLTWATAQGKMKSEEDWQAYAAANGGNCPYYSEGDSLTTFRMPCVLGYLRGSSVTTEGGTYKPQKLPNLKGKYSTRKAMGGVINDSTIEGVFERGEQVNSNAQIASATGNASSTLLFNAHNYDDRYEDGADVQPETFHVLVGVYAVGVITNINNTDVSQLQTGLATLEANAVKTINNEPPTAGNIDIDTSSDQYVPNYDLINELTFPFTAPCNGFVNLTLGADNVRTSLYLNGDLFLFSYRNDGTINIPMTFLIRKGDTITTSNNNRFYLNQFSPLDSDSDEIN